MPGAGAPACHTRVMAVVTPERTRDEITRLAHRGAGVREFALILTHPRLRGATGAWTSPIALV